MNWNPFRKEKPAPPVEDRIVQMGIVKQAGMLVLLPPQSEMRGLKLISLRGAGLAANQVGGDQRVIVVAWDRELNALINPRIVFRSPEVEIAQEGCLSIPGFFTTLRRHLRVTVDYLDEGFANKTIALQGEAARAAQHEVDHLDGKLIVDGLPRQQRRQAERLVQKASA